MQRAGESYNGTWQAVVSGSQFVAAEEIGGVQPTLTIDDVRTAMVESMDPGKPPSEKLIVYFAEARKGWIVNLTNGKCLGAMFGNNVQEWRGRQVTLTVEDVRFGSKTLPGIRVLGAPHLDTPLDVDVTLPRRRKTMRTLIPTGSDDGNGGMGDRE